MRVIQALSSSVLICGSGASGARRGTTKTTLAQERNDDVVDQVRFVEFRKVAENLVASETVSHVRLTPLARLGS